MLLFAALVLAATRLIETGAGPNRSGDAGGGVSPATDLRPRDARVLRVVDGDTILVRLAAGGTERVRYIGVDTPESVKPNTPVQCFGKRASHYNQQLVQNRDVHLVADNEPRDKYGRALAFVYVDNVLVNAELLKHGYARTLEIEPNTSKAAYFARLERVAIRTNQGLWGACDR